MKCILQIFSGRPNPEWNLTKEQFDHFIQLWEIATATTENSIPYSHLGYSGIELFKGNNNWHVYDGHASFTSLTEQYHKMDLDRKMEKFLIETAPEALQELVKSDF